MKDLKSIEKLKWLESREIRPYVFVRDENRIRHPGGLHKLDWFKHRPKYWDPLKMENVTFANRIMALEKKAFGSSGLAMERWVFYDCAIMPGFIAGFAGRGRAVSSQVIEVMKDDSNGFDWYPLSLFIIIPAVQRGDWVAHNLCSVNSFLPKPEQFWGLGFLSKAFGLWYANIRTCCGMTQWESPAIRLHSHYGFFEVLTAYTPVHSYARTLTYRLSVDVHLWSSFFSRQSDSSFHERHRSAGFEVHPTDDQSLKDFQKRLENREGPFFLDPHQSMTKGLQDPFTIYRSLS